MRCFFLAVLLFLSSFIGGCSQNNPLGATGTGALGGAAAGAGLGAIIGHQSGRAGEGVAIGAGAGAILGGLLGANAGEQNSRLDEQDGRIRSQDEQIRENQRLIEQLRALGTDAELTRRGVVVNLPDVLFEFDSARLTKDALRTTSEIAEVLRGIQGRTINVEGHTDSVGTLAYNQRLSEDRARSVADELVASGISRRRIFSRGFGESDPVASNRSEYGRERNRRVEIIVENRR